MEFKVKLKASDVASLCYSTETKWQSMRNKELSHWVIWIAFPQEKISSLYWACIFLGGKAPNLQFSKWHLFAQVMATFDPQEEFPPSQKAAARWQPSEHQVSSLQAYGSYIIRWSSCCPSSSSTHPAPAQLSPALRSSDCPTAAPSACLTAWCCQQGLGSLCSPRR